MDFYRYRPSTRISSLAYVFSHMHQASRLFIVNEVFATRAMCSNPYAATAYVKTHTLTMNDEPVCWQAMNYERLTILIVLQVPT